SLPPRKFAPEPIETSSKSSKDVRQHEPSSSNAATPKPRRFAVEPVESQHISSKDKKESTAEEKPKARRFAVQPVETEHKSSKHSSRASNGAASGEKSPPRRFAPQLAETSAKSNRGHQPEHNIPSHIKFRPEPVETTYRSNRKPQMDDEEVGPKDEGAKRPKRFTPVLVDTAKRSRRAGDAMPALNQSQKTESGHHLHAREHRRHIRGHKTPLEEAGDPMDTDSPSSSTQALDIPTQLRRHLAPLDGSAPQRRPAVQSQRTHSFRCPELDTIESSESEPTSDLSSLSSSPGQGSPITASDSSYNEGHKHATRIRESVDESFQHYLLELEAKRAAEQRLRDLANAAFPNSDYHEPVQHYVDEDGSDEMKIEDRPVTWADYEDEVLLQMARRRESTAKISWEQMEMQRHAEKLEQERNAAKTTAKQPTQSPWWNPATSYGFQDDEEEMRSMRDRARPPMLGADIQFPRCPSPEPARFDVTQGSTVLRQQMCYLTEHAESEANRPDEEVGLWHAPSPDADKGEVSVWSRKTSTKGSGKLGLWGGFCVDDGTSTAPASGGLIPPTGPTGLLTPRVERVENPFESSFADPSAAIQIGAGLRTPPTPPRSIQDGDLGRIDGVLNAEHDLDEVMEKEYPDTFITQVFNYLSLGYPTLARPFDEELSKISRVSIAELRKDDRKAKKSSKGYIRIGPDFEGDGMAEQESVRWHALKLYVREWARQEKNMVKVDGPGGNWGTGARRGSWAI
ncbi:hypothetical protein BAUCODRAFT_45003, partial [Baudoinia panamericana UAMH 10762]